MKTNQAVVTYNVLNQVGKEMKSLKLLKLKKIVKDEVSIVTEFANNFVAKLPKELKTKENKAYLNKMINEELEKDEFNKDIEIPEELKFTLEELEQFATTNQLEYLIDVGIIKE